MNKSMTWSVSSQRWSWVLAFAIPLVICAASLIAGGPAGQSKEGELSDTPREPRLIAVRFDADWCKVCKETAGEFAKLRKQVEGEPVLFMTLDMTDAKTRTQSEYLASVTGLNAIWKTASKRIGMLIVVDAESREELATLHLKHGTQKAHKALTASYRPR